MLICFIVSSNSHISVTFKYPDIYISEFYIVGMFVFVNIQKYASYIILRYVKI
jgi:hypothetical protein